MKLENEAGEHMHLADDLTLKEMVDFGLVVVLADNQDSSESCWVPVKEGSVQEQ